MTHMVEEVARHNGHADILREMIDGATGEKLGAASHQPLAVSLIWRGRTLLPQSVILPPPLTATGSGIRYALSDFYSDCEHAAFSP
jgi:hypothetical protein